MTSIIFSVDRADRSDSANYAARQAAENTLTSYGIPFALAEGCYRGQREISYMIARVPGPYQPGHKRVLDVVAELTAGQESVMHVDYNGAAYLQYSDGRTLELGRLRTVSREEAERRDAYTKVGGLYYVTE